MAVPYKRRVTECTVLLLEIAGQGHRARMADGLQTMEIWEAQVAAMRADGVEMEPLTSRRRTAAIRSSGELGVGVLVRPVLVGYWAQ